MKTSELYNPTLADISIQPLLRKIEEMYANLRVREPELLPWQEMEPEVIVSELVTGLPAMMDDQLKRLVIKVMFLAKITTATDSPDFYEAFYDVQVIPKLVEALNNVDDHLQDVEDVPHVSSLELAWFLDELVRVAHITAWDMAHLNIEFKKVCAYVLHEEGCPVPPMPFSIFVRPEDIHRYWYEGDMPNVSQGFEDIIQAKQKAIDTYVSLMRTQLC